jgi:hypothetical protein
MSLGDPPNTFPLMTCEYQHRLWFNYLEETFADLIGVLSLGAAFVYSQLAMLIRSILTHEEEGGNYTPAYDRLLIGSDLTHPIPLLRGKLGVYMYRKLISAPTDETNSHLADLDGLWDDVILAASPNEAIPMKDPHYPKTPLLQDASGSQGTLDVADTLDFVMPLVVDTLLDTKLRSLGNNSLLDVASKFTTDEQERDNLLKDILQKTSTVQNPKMRNSVAACLLAAYGVQPIAS